MTHGDAVSFRQSAAQGRRMVIWCPDWPVFAAGAARLSAAAVFNNGRVLACTSAARQDGVRRGMRKRDAQSLCPQLELWDYDPDRDARVFDEVLAIIEELSSKVTPIRPGLCALRPPGRFYGDEYRAGAVIAERLVQEGQWDCRIGIADTLFAATQAARRAPIQDTYVVQSSNTADFLRELPIDALDDTQLVDLLRRLGINTVGGFAALDPGDVITRFGAPGAQMHRIARGVEVSHDAARAVPPELTERTVFEPPVECGEQLAFSLRRPAEHFVSELAEHGMVCTQVRISIDTEAEKHSERIWLHPRWFSAADLLDRVRWQLQAGPPGGAATEVCFIPEVLGNLGDFSDTLFTAGPFGTGPDAQVDRSIARVQGMLGHESVQSAGIQGGRDPADRQLLKTWEHTSNRRSAHTGQQPGELPWPGSIPDPAPSRVYAEPIEAAVVTSRGEPVSVDGRGMISADPASFRAGPHHDWYPVAAWAGPWPIDEYWWDEACARRIARFQIVGVDGSAWLMTVEDGQWWVEAGYD